MKEKIKLLILNKYLLFLLGIIIVGFSIWYTNQLASVIKKQEIKQAKTIASSTTTVFSIKAKVEEQITSFSRRKLFN